jgi:recombination protein RecA
MPDLSKIQGAFSTIDKEIGKGVVVRDKDRETIQRVVLSSIGLNYVFHGGFPIGRIVEFFGPESSGKSLLATVIGADFQKAGKYVAYVDLEGTFERTFAERLGLTTDENLFGLIQPETGEDAFTIIEKLADTGEVGLVIVDSVAAMTPRSELEADYGDAQMGSMARMVSQGLRKLNSKLRTSGMSVIFVNQVRMKIGVMYGNPETTAGGRALPFYASSRNRITRKEELKNAQETTGIKIKISNKKSKIGPPMREIETNVFFDSGMDSNAELVQLAAKYSLIEKGGAWFTMPDGERVQGKEAAGKYLAERPETREKVFSDLYQILFGGTPGEEIEYTPEDEEGDDA